MRNGAGRPLRVGLVIGQLSTGGAEGQLRLFCEGVDRAAIEPTVYCLSGTVEPYGPRLERAGVRVRVLTGGRTARVRALRRTLRADRIDLVHAWLFIANAFAWAATRGGGPPLVTAARNCKRSGAGLDWLNRRAFADSAAIIVNSQQVAHYITDIYRAPADRIHVVHNAIDLTRFTARPDATAPVSAPVVIMVGRLVPQKNPHLFIAGAAALRDRLPGVRFQLVGGGPLHRELAAAAHDAGIGDCVELLGERHDVPALLQAADLFWLTSDWEGLPNAVLEAMASGLPVVATDVGGTAELVEAGLEGYVIQPGDRDGLVARSLEILGDPQRHLRMREAARARAERFGIPEMVARTRAVYATALGQAAA